MGWATGEVFFFLFGCFRGWRWRRAEEPRAAEGWGGRAAGTACPLAARPRGRAAAVRWGTASRRRTGRARLGKSGSGRCALFVRFCVLAPTASLDPAAEKRLLLPCSSAPGSALVGDAGCRRGAGTREGERCGGGPATGGAPTAAACEYAALRSAPTCGRIPGAERPLRPYGRTHVGEKPEARSGGGSAAGARLQTRLEREIPSLVTLS